MLKRSMGPKDNIRDSEEALIVIDAWTKLTSLYHGGSVCLEQVQGFVVSRVVKELFKSKIICHVKEKLAASF